jgi:predicted nucleic acid-binding protein
LTPGPDSPVLADSSAWIDHLRRGHAGLSAALEARLLVTHEFVLGELMLGALARSRTAIADLQVLSRVSRATHDEVVTLVRAHRLDGCGIGWVDAHILASARMAGARVLTIDKAMGKAASRLGVAY